MSTLTWPEAPIWPEAPTTRRILMIAIPLVAMAGTLLLCLGTGDFTIAVIMGCAVGLSFYLTEWTGLFRIGPLTANIAAIVAVVAAGLDFIRGGREGQLVAIANLLVYLQIILLFQQKSVRVYWHIVLLSLLQVVVGAALSLSPTFGITLFGFVLLGVFTLHGFFLAREVGQFEHAGPGPEAPRVESARENDRAADASARRWPYAGLPMDFSAVAVAIEERPAERVRRLATTTLVTLAFSLPAAGVVFFTVPRMGRDPWRAGPAEQQRAVGFSQEVRLGELGTVYENPEVVMRVKFIDPRTGEGFQLENTPMLRGTVVTKYEQGGWRHHGKRFETATEELDPPPRQRPFVIQEISLQPLSEPVVFSVYPAFARTDQPIVYDVDREQLVRDPEILQRAQLNLQIETTGFDGRRQAEFYPAEKELRFSYDHFRLTELPTSFGPSGLPAALSQETEKALAAADALDADTYTVCRTLEHYLQQDGGFTYTLTSPPRTSGTDPVEDFLLNNRTGNCEYYASALALMLRSRQIPARVVIGYQGGEWNPVGQFYQFRQLHAHSWVEAYLEPEEVARHVENPRRFRRGAWLRLDPTAVTLEPVQEEPTGVLARMRQATEYAELVWVKYIVGMNSRRQQQALYGPLREGFLRMIDPVTFVQSIRATLYRWYASLRDWLRGNWFSWRGGLVAMLACTLCLAVFWLVRALVRRVRMARDRGRAGSRARGSVVPFYERLEDIFATAGITRLAGQTQREFAMSVAGHLAESPATRPYAGLPRRIVDAFYGIRFGRLPLSPAEEQELTAELAALEVAVQRPA